ncbi:hypothetical protein O1611_g603 [Lasiodiplodia mahajangana]|uniref:Uncharacterized protein n=1 Tax=Lasiodiplodia mahajangana TaxID=1108764 RepID=A0ACC2JZV4_9PEZI|nr:hypothetical protein O1611_g603 [Lasiodiplodia mahajangana]
MQDSVNETSVLYQNIWCVYPLSGTYTRFQRFTFYATIVIAFVFRSQQWVSSVAMGSLFVYSAVAAVHAIPLSVQQSLGADTDIIAVFSIVLISLYCAIMARMYSPRFIGRNFNDFYNWWMIGLTIPAVVATIGFARFANSTPGHVLQLRCPDPSDCPDPCDLLVSQVLFRGGPFDDTAGIVLDSWYETIADAGGDGNQTSILGPPVDNGHINRYQATPTITEVFEIVALYIFFIFGQQNQYNPPRSTRNKVFRRLRLKRVMSAPSDSALTSLFFHVMYYAYISWRCITFFIPLVVWFRRRLKRVGLTWSLEKWINDRSRLEEINTRSREKYARNLALVWYILCMVGYVGAPITLLLIVVELELGFFNEIPESEAPQTAGQWGPAVVGLGFTFLLARWLEPTLETHESVGLFRGEHDAFSHENGQRVHGWYWKYSIFATPLRELRDLRAWYRNPTLASQENEISKTTQQNTPPTSRPRDIPDKDIELSYV